MAVQCSSCGASNSLEESECSLCGARLHDASSEATQTSVPALPAEGAEPTSSIPEAVAASIRGVIVGGKVANRYRVNEMLGRGGVAMVFRATDESLGEEIALKVFPNLRHQDPGDIERFKREVLVNRKIHHQNVIRVHDFGTVGDDAYLTMELLAGGTLAERIEEKALPVLEAVEIAIGVAEGLHAAHTAGIVHRDVKPENVLFDASGRPKLVDFGLARLLDTTTQNRGGFSGTPFYMSPEQADGREITEQTDLYSLGILLFELFTGQLPFFADSLVGIAMKHASEPPPRPSSIRPGIPPIVEELILKCLKKAPADRPSSAAQVATTLRKWRREGGIDAAKVLDASTPGQRRPRPRVRTPSDPEAKPLAQRETVIARLPRREADRETEGRAPASDDTFETGKRQRPLAQPPRPAASGAPIPDAPLSRPSGSRPVAPPRPGASDDAPLSRPSGSRPAMPRPAEPDTGSPHAALVLPPAVRPEPARPSSGALPKLSREQAMELPPERPRSRAFLVVAVLLLLAIAGGAALAAGPLRSTLFGEP